VVKPPSCDVTLQVTDHGGQTAQDRSAAPGPRRAAGAVTVLWAEVVLAALAGVAMTILVQGDLARGDLAINLGDAAGAAAYATLGALIVRRAGNVVGWLMLGMAGALAFVALASVYAVAGIVTFPGSLPAARVVGALAQASFAPALFALAFLFLLFPTGTLPSRRWLPVAAAGFVLAGLATVGLVVHPGPVGLPAPGGVSLIIANPLGVEHLGRCWARC